MTVEAEVSLESRRTIKKPKPDVLDQWFSTFLPLRPHFHSWLTQDTIKKNSYIFAKKDTKNTLLSQI
jgi:hypothetical protein